MDKRASSQWTPRRLIGDGAAYSAGPHKSRNRLIVTAQRLLDLDARDRAESCGMILQLLHHAVDVVFQHGWQPIEIVHAGQRLPDQAAHRLLLALISAHSRRRSASTTAPQRWVTQLHDLDIDTLGSGHVDRWAQNERVHPLQVWIAQLSILGFLSRLQPMTPLLAVPSSWSSSDVHRVAVARPGDDRVLAKIRGLLAKAESTSFPAEAEALSSKAQDLMTRHAIDTAMVASADHDAASLSVATRRLLVDNPYPETKVSLLQSVARPNDVRVVFHREHGIVTVIGMPIDLDFCELLFTSLLVQASHAMERSGEHRTRRSVSYRRSFLYAFADGIGDRLAKARDAASHEASTRYGSALVPVLQARANAVDEAFRDQFPQTTTTSRTVSNRDGWIAGRVAAEHADLTTGTDRIDRGGR